MEVMANVKSQGILSNISVTGKVGNVIVQRNGIIRIARQVRKRLRRNKVLVVVFELVLSLLL